MYLTVKQPLKRIVGATRWVAMFRMLEQTGDSPNRPYMKMPNFLQGSPNNH